MKFNIYVTLASEDGRRTEVPNNSNPIACDNVRALLMKLAGELPELNFGLRYVGLRIVQADGERNDDEGSIR